MKIVRYQSGGIYYTPFFGNKQPQAETKTTKEENLLQKEVISILKENGLPSDVDTFLSKANSLLISTKNLFGTGDDFDMSDIIKLQSMANRIRHNSSLHSKAVARLNEEGSGSEAAITNDGKIYVLSDDGLQTISGSAYKENPDNYQVLTNAELITLRESNDNLAYRSDILNDLSSNIGMKSIMDYINKTINEFGTNKSSSSTQRYTAKQKGQIEQGLQDLLSLGPDGYYKVTQDSSISDQGYGGATEEERTRNRQMATRYLMETLPQGMKNVLVAKSAIEGTSPAELLEYAIYQNTDHAYESEVKVDYDSTTSKTRGSGSGSGKESLAPASFGTMVHRNMGQQRPTGVILPGSNLEFNLPSYWYNLQTLDEGAISNVSTAAEVDKIFRDHGLRDGYNKAYFGGVPINNMSFEGQGIVVDNTKGFTVSYLPVDENGELDTSIMQTMSDIQAEIVSNRITDIDEKRKIWENNGFVYDETKDVGIIPGMQLKRFGMLNAYASTKSLDKESLNENPYLSRIDDSILENISGAYNINSKGKQNIDIVPGMFGKSFQGVLFIPINENENETYVAGGIGYIDKPNVDIVKARQDFANQQGMYNAGTGTYNRSILSSVNDL